MMRRLLPVLPAGLVVAVLVAACAGPATAPPEPQTWTLAAEPDLIIGEDGTPEGEFNRINAVIPLPGGELLVADAGESALKVFSESGEYLRAIGRQGEGPGEFRSISWVALEGDTLIVHDFSIRRLTFLHLDGTLLNVVVPRPQGPTASVRAQARMPDGRWLVSGLKSYEGEMPAGVVRDTFAFGLLPASGEGDVEYFHRDLTGSMVRVEGINAGVLGFASSWPLGNRLGGRIVVLRPETGMMTVYDANGIQEAALPLPMPMRPITGSERSRLRAEALEAARPERKAFAEARFADGAVPEHYPAFASVVPDGEERLWFEAWEHEPPPSRRYWVVSIAGEWVAEITMPPGFQPMTIGPDWVLGIHRDDDGVQRVMRYGLERR
jgi:hypothetical protein